MKDGNFDLCDSATLDVEAGVGYITDGDAVVALTPRALNILRDRLAMPVTAINGKDCQLSARAWVSFFYDGSAALGLRKKEVTVSLTKTSVEFLRTVLLREMPNGPGSPTPFMRLSDVTGGLTFGYDLDNPQLSLGPDAVNSLRALLRLPTLTTTEPAEDSMALLGQLNRAVAEFYGDDPTTAGVTTAWLPKGDGAPCAYVSVCRYRAAYGGEKEVVAKAKGPSLEAALKTLAQEWLEALGSGAEVKKLAKVLEGRTSLE